MTTRSEGAASKYLWLPASMRLDYQTIGDAPLTGLDRGAVLVDVTWSARELSTAALATDPNAHIARPAPSIITNRMQTALLVRRSGE